jgi:hypothetical protein
MTKLIVFFRNFANAPKKAKRQPTTGALLDETFVNHNCVPLKEGTYKPEDALTAMNDTCSVPHETFDTDFDIACFDLHYPGRLLGHEHGAPENCTSQQT